MSSSWAQVLQSYLRLNSCPVLNITSAACLLLRQQDLCLFSRTGSGVKSSGVGEVGTGNDATVGGEERANKEGGSGGGAGGAGGAGGRGPLEGGSGEP